MSNFNTLKKNVIKIKDLLELYKQLGDSYFNQSLDKAKLIQDSIVDFEKKNHIDFILSDLPSLFNDSDEGLIRVSEIVKSLKIFSRVDQGNVYEEYDLNANINNTLVVARNEIKYTAKVEKHLGELPTIKAAGGQINQVLLNIIINAVHTIKEKKIQGDGILKIKTYCDNRFVFCEIEDNGMGIEEENLKKIFDPFFTTKPVGQGTGLGLSIVYDIIVNKHQGEISAESTKGIGTKFIIKLPINLNMKNE